MKTNVRGQFDLSGRIAVVTGGAGLLGGQHAEAIAEFGGIPALLDLNVSVAQDKAKGITSEYSTPCLALQCDVTKKTDLEQARERLLHEFGHIDILINNAALDPKVTADMDSPSFNRLESMSVSRWDQEMAVGLTGAFLCAQVFGTDMARRRSGTIINISSDLGIIAPDQRLYRKPDVPEDEQPVKPVTYSVIKHGLIGLTKYLSTYWAGRGVRVNALCPSGIQVNQPDEFVARLSSMIPLGRMAKPDEYKAAIVFLASDASSFMTGATLVLDGGRSVW
jgi:NAD(P)-dependent dehydrogenase (short-subunit alcohol dehydrogenase family)